MAGQERNRAMPPAVASIRHSQQPTGIRRFQPATNWRTCWLPGPSLDFPSNLPTWSSTSVGVTMKLYAADNWKLRRNLTLDAGVRYSILAPPFQPNNQFTSFRQELYNPNLPSTDACNGLVTVPGYTPCANANKVFGTNFTEAAAGPQP